VMTQMRSQRKKLRNILWAKPPLIRKLPMMNRNWLLKKPRTKDGIRLIDSPDLSTIKTDQKHLLQKAPKSEVWTCMPRNQELIKPKI
jgi:hypothetical protein